MDSSGNISLADLDKCIFFSIDKERYTPYSSFNGSFITSDYYEEIISIEFFIDDYFVHYGSIDKAKMTFKEGNYRLDISSRSYTLALGLNQPTPQINPSVTLDNLLSRNVFLNNVTCEENTREVNYIYVLENSTLWDAVVAYSLKAYGTYPFVYQTNEVRVTRPQNNVSRTYGNEVLEVYNVSTLSNLISDIHMKDTQGNYDQYNLDNPYAIERDVIRHKQIPLDMQWLSNPIIALSSRINYSQRGAKRKGIKVLGYLSEELFDEFTYYFNNEVIENCIIHKLNITGKNNIVYTTMYQYDDVYKDLQV